MPLHMLAHTGNSLNRQQQRCLSTIRYQVEGNVVRDVFSRTKHPRLKITKHFAKQRAGSFEKLPTKPARQNENGIQKLNRSDSKAHIPGELRPDLTTMRSTSDTNITSHSSVTPKSLTHLNESGSAHMVDITTKRRTNRVAVAVATLFFSEPTTFSAIKSASIKKGDALAVSRIAAIQGAKQTSNLIPLAHPALDITGVEVEVLPFAGDEENITIMRRNNPIAEPEETSYVHGGVAITAKVQCYGKTGVEMEALTAATLGSLTMYDMLKGIDKNMIIVGPQVIEKLGGKTGDWKWDKVTRRLVNTGIQHSQPDSSLVKVLPKASPESQRSKDTSISAADNSTGTSHSSQDLNDDIEEWNRGLSEEFAVPMRKIPNHEKPASQKLNTTVSDIHRKVKSLTREPKGVQNKAERPASPQNNHGISTVLSPRSATGSVDSTPSTPAADTHRPEESEGSETNSPSLFRTVVHSQTRIPHRMVTRDMISDDKIRARVDQRDFENARVKRFEEWVKNR